MKKIVFAVVIAAIAASPAAAATKKKKKEMASAPVTSTASNNENSLKFAKDSLPVFLPSWSMPAYMAITKPPQTQPQR
jgi:hypothetical protein